MPGIQWTCSRQMAAELCRKGTRFVDIPDFVVRLRERDTLGVYDMIDVFFYLHRQKIFPKFQKVN